MKIVCLCHYFLPYLYSSTPTCTSPLISQDIHRFCFVYTTTCTFSAYYMNAVRITLFLFSHYGLVILNNDKSYKNFHAILMLYRQLHFNLLNVFLVQYLQYLFFISDFDKLPHVYYLTVSPLSVLLYFQDQML